MAKKSYKLDDSVISTIAKTLQLALLTGTDIVDNLRQIRIQNNGDGSFGITQEYNSQFEHWVAQMLEDLENHQSSENYTQEEFETEEKVKGLFE